MTLTIESDGTFLCLAVVAAYRKKIGANVGRTKGWGKTSEKNKTDSLVTIFPSGIFSDSFFSFVSQTNDINE
jgi:hypothetical protein